MLWFDCSRIIVDAVFFLYYFNDYISQKKNSKLKSTHCVYDFATNLCKQRTAQNVRYTFCLNLSLLLFLSAVFLLNKNLHVWFVVRNSSDCIYSDAFAVHIIVVKCKKAATAKTTRRHEVFKVLVVLCIFTLILL